MPDLLGNWLYGVALRTAGKARGRLDSPAQERGGRPDVEPAPVTRRRPVAEQVIDREQAEAAAREIDRLPGAFRLAGRALLLRGPLPRRGRAPAAMPSGTLRSRLARAARSSAAA